MRRKVTFRYTTETNSPSRSTTTRASEVVVRDQPATVVYMAHRTMDG